MNPKIWGPHAWFFLHTICLNYPDKPTKNDKNIYKNFFVNLQNIIPCEKCKKHYNSNLKKHNINTSLNCKKDLLQWCVNIQNELRMCNKQKPFTLNEVLCYYNRKYSNNTINIDKIYIYIIIFISIIFIIFYIIVLQYYLIK